MYRPNLHSLPTPPSSPPPLMAIEAIGAESAELELTEFFGDLLARGENDDESPDYDRLEAAVDGRLDPVEAELFASRLVGDAVLEREFGDLVALRDRLSRSRQGPPTVRPFASPWGAGGRRWLGVAAAALLLAVLGVEVRHNSGKSEARLAASARADQASAQPLFSDSFEDGSTDRWSN